MGMFERPGNIIMDKSPFLTDLPSGTFVMEREPCNCSCSCNEYLSHLAFRVRTAIWGKIATSPPSSEYSSLAGPSLGSSRNNSNDSDVYARSIVDLSNN